MKLESIAKSLRRSLKRYLSFLLIPTLFSSLLVMTGCGMFASDDPEPFEIESFEVTTELNANRDSPTSIDVVEIYDEQLRTQIEALDSESWFVQKKGLIASNSDLITVTSWELPPGATIKDERWNSLSRNPTAILVFLALKSGTPNRVALRSREGTFSLTVTSDGFDISVEDGS